MTEEFNGALVLDTHVWIWLEMGESRLQNSPAFAALEEAKSRGRLTVSAISIWELATLEAKGKIRLYQDCRQWADKALSAPGIFLQPITPEIAVESARLLGYFHADPADRILVATARSLGAPLVTADPRILAYAGKGYLKVLEV